MKKGKQTADLAQEPHSWREPYPPHRLENRTWARQIDKVQSCDTSSKRRMLASNAKSQPEGWLL